MEKRDPFVHATFEVLHGMPEIAYEETRTSAYLAEQLESMGYAVTRNIGTTGVMGVLDSGKPGPHFGLRADIDALRFEIDGKIRDIHACGHDANSAMVLAAAKRASEKGIARGKLYIVFQQAEERLGAPKMIESGKLGDIREIVAIHLRPVQEAVLGQATPALRHGATHFAFFEVIGHPAHSARPHLGINAVDAAASIVAAINAIHEDPAVPHSIKCTQIASVGNGINTIPDRVRLTVDMRAQNNEVADSLIAKLEKVARGTAALYGASVEGPKYEGTPAADYDDDLVDLGSRAIEAVLGSVIPCIRTVGGDDFHYFSTAGGMKTAYIGLGANVTEGLHHPEMSFDHAALDHGADILEKLVELRLNS